MRYWVLVMMLVVPFAADYLRIRFKNLPKKRIMKEISAHRNNKSVFISGSVCVFIYNLAYLYSIFFS